MNTNFFSSLYVFDAVANQSASSIYCGIIIRLFFIATLLIEANNGKMDDMYIDYQRQIAYVDRMMYQISKEKEQLQSQLDELVRNEKEYEKKKLEERDYEQKMRQRLQDQLSQSYNVYIPMVPKSIAVKVYKYSSTNGKWLGPLLQTNNFNQNSDAMVMYPGTKTYPEILERNHFYQNFDLPKQIDTWRVGSVLPRNQYFSVVPKHSHDSVIYQTFLPNPFNKYFLERDWQKSLRRNGIIFRRELKSVTRRKTGQNKVKKSPHESTNLAKKRKRYWKAMHVNNK